MRIRFLEIAQIEMDEVIEYYNYEELFQRHLGVFFILNNNS